MEIPRVGVGVVVDDARRFADAEAVFLVAEQLGHALVAEVLEAPDEIRLAVGLGVARERMELRRGAKSVGRLTGKVQTGKVLTGKVLTGKFHTGQFGLTEFGMTVDRPRLFFLSVLVCLDRLWCLLL